MLKAPVIGDVKTRLGKQIGAANAVAAYRNLVEHQIKQIPPDWHTHVCHSPPDALAAMRNWLGNQHEYSAQVEGDLGKRLIAATSEHFRRSAGKLLVLGGDCPYLESKQLGEAALALDKTDVAIVPAQDGGYCLIGMRRAIPHVFHAISWSTAEVFDQTRARLAELQLSWTKLEIAEDVDDNVSWQRAVKAYPGLVPRPR